MTGIAKRMCEWFGIPEAEGQLWCDNKTTMEKALNLSPSEDASITHFLVPFLRNALGYAITDIDVKQHLTKNEGRQVNRIGGQSDVIVRKNGDPVIVIEVKSYGHPLKTATENAEGQAYDYSQANELKPRPKYYVATNVEETHVYETLTRQELPFSPVNEREIFDKFEIVEKVLGKKNIIPLGKRVSQPPLFRAPMLNQKEFERILFNCQDEMREASESKTGIRAFAEMNKLLFIKLYEDRREREGKENRFTYTKVLEEGENYIGGTLFEDIKTHYRQKNVRIFKTEDKLLLDDVTINRIVKKLERIFMVDEDGKVYPPVAHVYENFVSTIFRGENGQYFTPRRIVDFLVGMVGVSWGASGVRCVDPACGSGGFLLSVFSILDNELKTRFMVKQGKGEETFLNEDAKREHKVAKRRLCEELLIGFDNEEDVAKTAAMNMSVHGDGSTGINFGDSLKREAFKTILIENYFMLALTNPPFSSTVKPKSHIDIDGRDALEGYELSHVHKYNPEQRRFVYSKREQDIRSRDSKILFIERCYQLLANGGILGIVVDDGVVNNPRESYVRDFIKRNFNIKAIVSLPWGVFKEQDANNFTSILLLQKKGDGIIQDNDIFMGIAKYCGENYGKSTRVMPNNLTDILADYRAFCMGRKTKFSEYSFICKAEDLENYHDEETKQFNNRLDPKFYSPRLKEIEKIIMATGKADKIGNVVNFEREEVAEDVNQFGSKYIERITKSGDVEYGVIDGTHDPKLKKTQIFRKGDLVVSRIQLKNGIVGIIPDELDEIRATDEYYKLIPKKDATTGKEKVLRKYLRIVLTSEPINYLVNSTFTGQYGRMSEDDLGRLAIPAYETDKQREIVEKYESKKQQINTLITESVSKEEALMKEVISDIFPSIF
ncbi:MAG: N-6 DNA methylase [Candidatus Bathyarchaeia archaeon]